MLSKSCQVLWSCYLLLCQLCHNHCPRNEEPFAVGYEALGTHHIDAAQEDVLLVLDD